MSFIPENERARAAREHELRNMRVMNDIFVSGTDEEMKELQAVHGHTDEQMESLRYWARLRRDEVKASKDSRRHGKKTDEENAIGVYLDRLEPQVVEAVRILNQKGYKTRYSGFEGFGTKQTIWLVDETDLFPLPENVQEELEEEWGVKISYPKPGEIWIDCLETRLTPRDLKKIWDRIAEAVPEKVK